MHARAQALTPLAGDLSARTAYADTERPAKIPPVLLDEWMPAFLAQLTAPGAQFVCATVGDGTRNLYLFDAERESFAAFTKDTAGWTVRQGGPMALWDAVEETLTAWRDAGSPNIASVRLHITMEAHTYWIGGQQITTNSGSCSIGDQQALRWEHRLT
ncbi:hypothetical protein [Streptomyces sp. NPDC050121]|uniref:hypothetical protein n=1 Tax=Streptomyces sp. NPDC050121 TaxID=3365601 RepID=UPI0037BDB184